MNEEQLRNEIRWLGALLGQTIETQQGAAALQLVERVRELSKTRRLKLGTAEAELVKLIDGLSSDDLMTVIRAFSIFFDLANLSEDRHRARVLRQRENESLDKPRAESIAAAMLQIKAMNVEPDELQALLSRLQVEPVFTAHPTEAKRRSLREKIRDLREHLAALDNSNLTRREREQLEHELKIDLMLLWQSDFLRERRPTVLEELERSLFFFDNLWRVTPELYRQLKSSLKQCFPGQQFSIPKMLQFGTWIGGDRDGNPNVTCDITLQAMRRLREFVLMNHHRQARALRRRLSLSDHQAPLAQDVVDHLNKCLSRWAALAAPMAPISPTEGCRKYLRMVQWRLEQTLVSDLGQAPVDGSYQNARELQLDVQRLRDSIAQLPGGNRLMQPLDQWLVQIEVFGFHAMRMDIRQESEWYRQVIDELFRYLLISSDYLNQPEDRKQQLLLETLGGEHPISVDEVSPQAQETLRLFQLVAGLVKQEQGEALGQQIISMTQHPSDVLSVLWLSAWATRDCGLAAETVLMPIVPLFETIGDLKGSADSLEQMFSNASYRQFLTAQSNHQTVMIGYSDSTKDGGYLSAAWEQYRAQVAMSQVAERHGARVTFFHGRGGALGRGGGPAARAVLSSPRQIIDGAMRLTEQGEVLSARYDDPQIASRHLEQLISATMLVSLAPTVEISENWTRSLDQLAEFGLRAYRELVEDAEFLDYFELATPISEIEQLPIGSRPARRGGQRSLSRLRAIPWVFSWTQNRHLLPAWYGIGSALDQFQNSVPEGAANLRAMYQHWPFFEGLIENAALALAKTDLSIGAHYSQLAATEHPNPVWEKITQEYRLSCDSVLRIAQRDTLMGNVTWLRDSIEIRNPYVDPLNLAQVHLLQQRRNLDESDPNTERTKELLRMTIQGIAAGLRTTG